jgi:Tol biopolymer transport system component
MMRSAALLFLPIAMSWAQSMTIETVMLPTREGEKPACVSLPEDERSMVYQSAHAGGFGGLDLWLSTRQGERWSTGENLGAAINTAAHEADAKFSADGRTLVFIRGSDLKANTDIYVSEFRMGRWTEAQLIGPPISLPSTLEFGAVLSHDSQSLYFSSNRAGGHGGFDHYVTRRKADGSWSDPVNLGPAVNTSADELDLALSRDGRYMVFPMKRADSIGGSTDLYVSESVAGQWTEAVNLGPRINTPGSDACPWLGFDGKSLYLNSNWDGLLQGRVGTNRIWRFVLAGGMFGQPAAP